MKTNLLLTGALVFICSLIALPLKSDAQTLADLNQGGMSRIFQELAVYPNPFDDKIIVSYTLPYDNDVSIEVFNALGQLVKQYSASAVRQQAGTHQIILFRPESADPGIYFVRLTIPDTGSLTKRVMAK